MPATAMARNGRPITRARREPFALRSSYFVNELTDDLSTAMVKRIQNRYRVDVWPRERDGFSKTKVT